MSQILNSKRAKYGYVVVSSERGAMQCLRELNRFVLLGNSIRLSLSVSFDFITLT